MLRHEPTSAFALGTQLETAVTRNATILVTLRHLIAHVHVSQNGHQLGLPWTQCRHERCQAVQRLVGPEQAS